MEKLSDQNPTTEFYQALVEAFNHFNLTLFNSELPSVMFSIQRQKNVMGYFSSQRWGDNKRGQNSKKTCDEIAINPDYVGRSAIIELFQTLVHEMAHQWQFCFGKPSKRAYHNKEWANKMIEIGLMPSDTGKVGGKITGEKMNDYPIEGGEFLKQSIALLESNKFSVPWVDRHARVSTNSAETMAVYSDLLPECEQDVLESLTSTVSTVFESLDLDDDSEYLETPVSKNKTRYTCPECKSNVWGKPNLKIGCLECDKVMYGSD